MLDLVWGVFSAITLSAVVTSLLGLRAAQRTLSRSSDRASSQADELSQRAKVLEDVQKSMFRHMRMRWDPDFRLQTLMATTPKTFFYLDESMIDDLYAQVVQEPSPEEISVQERAETRKGIIGRIKVLEPEYARTSGSNVTSIYRPTVDAAIKYNFVQDYLLQGEAIEFGIDDFAFDPGEEADEISELFLRLPSSNFPEELINEMLERFTAAAKEAAVTDKFDQLARVSGYVAMHSDFVVEESQPDSLRLRLRHIVNNYIDDPALQDVSIIVVGNSDGLTSYGRASFVTRNSIRAVVVGHVVSWNEMPPTLTIVPIAIY